MSRPKMTAAQKAAMSRPKMSAAQEAAIEEAIKEQIRNRQGRSSFRTKAHIESLHRQLCAQRSKGS